MPVGPGRFRVTTTKTGKKVRLHFTPSGTVNEAKALDSGAVHTPGEFAKDRAKRNSLQTHLASLKQRGAFAKKGKK